MTVLLLLLACRSSTREATDTVYVSDDTGGPLDTAGDTADTVDSDPVDTGEELPENALHTWPGAFTAPDLRVTACGGRDDGPTSLAIGPDLDGDGLPELAAGTAGADGDTTDAGAVRLYRARDLAAGLDADDAHAWVVGDAEGAGLGARVQWVGDRDGDGVDDLLTTGAGQPMRLLSGAGLAAGGPRGVLAEIAEEGGRALPWDDVDGDGVDDWLLGLPDRGVTGTGSSRGGIAAVLDADFDTDGSVDFAKIVHDAGGYGLAGTALALLGTDHDRDGIREPVTNLGDDLVVVNSATMLDWASWVDDGVRWRFVGRAGDDLVSLGDVDEEGREDVLLRSDTELCVAFGEEGDPVDTGLWCVLWASTAIVAGDDLGGDGVPEVWVGGEGEVRAFDGAELANGRLTSAARVVVDGTVATLAYADGELLVGLDVPDRWTPATAAVVVPAADAATPTATWSGGGSGGDPAAPSWRDLDGDGAEELLFYDDALFVFAGAGLAGGGDRSLCDADVGLDLGAGAISWVDDRSGDGVDELVAAGLPAEGQVAVLDGAALLSGTLQVTSSWTSEDAALPLEGCDIDGDGLDELVAWTGGVGTRVWSGAVGEAPVLLGTVDGTVDGCLPDLDGDGGAELLAQGWYVFSGASLSPDETLGWRDARLALPLDGDPGWRSLLGVEDPDGDGVPALAWWRVDGGVAEVGAVLASDLAGAADAADLPFTSWATGGPAYAVAWFDAVLDAAGDDPVWIVLDEEGSAVGVQAKGEQAVYSLVTLPTRAAADASIWTLAPAPDLPGAGARAISLVWGGEDAGRPELGVLFSR